MGASDAQKPSKLYKLLFLNVKINWIKKQRTIESRLSGGISRLSNYLSTKLSTGIGDNFLSPFVGIKKASNEAFSGVVLAKIKGLV